MRRHLEGGLMHLLAMSMLKDCLIHRFKELKARARKSISVLEQTELRDIIVFYLILPIFMLGTLKLVIRKNLCVQESIQLQFNSSFTV